MKDWQKQMRDGIVAESGAELRDDEIVCEQTGYTYHRDLPQSPHVDKDGVQGW